jgi:hypothetical protein
MATTGALAGDARCCVKIAGIIDFTNAGHTSLLNLAALRMMVLVLETITAGSHHHVSIAGGALCLESPKVLVQGLDGFPHIGATFLQSLGLQLLGHPFTEELPVGTRALGLGHGASISWRGRFGKEIQNVTLVNQAQDSAGWNFCSEKTL